MTESYRPVRSGIGADLFEVALEASVFDLTVIPVCEDGSKRPIGPWKKYQTERPSRDELRGWFADGRSTGIGVVCGEASGNLEMFEFEGRAVDEGMLAAFVDAAGEVGIGDLVQRIAAGYSESTPSGGVHWLYRIEAGTRAENAKIAMSCGSEEESLTLIETKGEGGYSIVAPSYGTVHPSGSPWQIAAGGFASIITITAEERDALVSLGRSFDQRPRTTPTGNRPAALAPRDTSVGDDFEARTSWEEVLAPHGWTSVGTARDGTTMWRRPGKDHGMSATTNYAGQDLFTCFTSSSVFEPSRTYGKFRAYAVLNHGGEVAAAASALRARGFGGQADQSKRPRARKAARDGAISIRKITDFANEEYPEMTWGGRLVRGGITLFAGDEGLGKSTVRDHVLAALTGGPIFSGWAADDPHPVGDVVILTYEENRRMILERLRTLGADLNRVHILGGREVTDDQGNRTLVPIEPQDLWDVRDRIRDDCPDCVALVIDPWKNLVGDINDPKVINPACSAVSAIASELNLYVPVVAHMNATGSTAGYKGLEQQARTRIEFRREEVASNDATSVALIHASSNVGPKATGLTYEFRTLAKGSGWGTGDNPLTWTGTTQNTSQSYVGRSTSLIVRAAAWLRAELADGQPVDSSELVARGEDEGFKQRTLQRARERAGDIEIIKNYDGTSDWRLVRRSP